MQLINLRFSETIVHIIIKDKYSVLIARKYQASDTFYLQYPLSDYEKHIHRMLTQHWIPVTTFVIHERALSLYESVGKVETKVFVC